MYRSKGMGAWEPPCDPFWSEMNVGCSDEFGRYIIPKEWEMPAGQVGPGAPSRVCTKDMFMCPDGTSVGRGADCAFLPCPTPAGQIPVKTQAPPSRVAMPKISEGFATWLRGNQTPVLLGAGALVLLAALGGSGGGGGRRR